MQLRFKDLLCPGNGGDVGGVLNKGVLPFPLDALGFDAEDLAAVVDLGRVGIPPAQFPHGTERALLFQPIIYW